MKTKATRMKAMIGLFALLTVTVVLAIGAAPAVAGPVHVDDSISDLLHPSGVMAEMQSLINAGLLDDVMEALAPDGPFPDGGDWEPVFPDDGDDEAVPAEEEDACDDGGDEAVEEPPAEGDDEAVDEADEEVCDEEAPADAGDEAVEEVPADAGDDAGDEAILEDATSEPDEELPYTGGDTLPWIIGGAGVILAGAILLFCLRGKTESH
jgi:hypothetical protein